MSRIGKLPITVPSGVDVAIDGRTVTVKGPKGTLSHTVAEPITRRACRRRHRAGSSARTTSGAARRMHGLSRTLVKNLVIGVTAGYEKKLEIHGVGYRVALRRARTSSSRSATATRSSVEPPEGITFAVESPHAVLRVGHRQAAGRRDRREHPQAPQARTRTRARACGTRARTSAARSERRVSDHELTRFLPTRRSAPRQARLDCERRRSRTRRHVRLRKKISGTPARPRLVVNRARGTSSSS